MNLIEKEDKVIVVKNEDAFVFQIIDSKLITKEETPEDVYEYAIEQTEYSKPSTDDIEWPLSFSDSHHLEDTLYISAIEAVAEESTSELAQEIFEEKMDSRIDKPAISLSTNWELQKDGTVRLKTVEYNDVLFTPE